MSAACHRLSRARRYFDVFEDSWKTRHKAAMECRDFEENLGEAARVFDLVHDLILARREAVYRGVLEPDASLDQEERKLYEDWLALIESDLPRVKELEASFGELENAAAIRACTEKARAFLDSWTSALPATAVGSRVVDFSEDDADELGELLKSPPGAAGRPTRPPRSLPEGDSSLLK